MLGVVLTTYLCVTLLIVHYVFYFDPDVDPFRSSHNNTLATPHPNPVDRVLFSAFQRVRVFVFKRSSVGHKNERLESAVNKVSYLVPLSEWRR